MKIYSKTDEKVKKWNRWINLLMVKVTPIGATLPKFILSFLLYFATDLGQSAFELPFFEWYSN